MSIPKSASPPATPAATPPEGEEELLRSIENSRKRHLSPNTLRGDQAVDRLLAQEPSASPLLKSAAFKYTPAAKKMALTKEDFQAYMAMVDARANKRFDSLEGSVAGVATKLDNARLDIQTNSSKIDSQALIVQENKRNIDKLAEDVLKLKNAPSTKPSYASAAAAATPLSNDEEEYAKARRSIRLWPVMGTIRDDIWRNTENFIKHKLGLSAINERDIKSISRPGVPSGIAALDEVIVVFVNVADRDSVVGASAKLAGNIDARGRPTAGIRLEVPRKLRASFSTLFRFGQQLRKRHGEGTRRHVKFDDGTQALYLNVKLPGEDGWNRVSIEVAKRGLRARQLLDDEELERRLDAAGPLNDRPRSASLSAIAMDTSSAPSAGSSWSGRASVGDE